MEKYHIEKDLSVLGREVKTFPLGIGQAFDDLMALFPAADKRPYYGISFCTGYRVVYRAAALETFDGEAESHGCERYIIEKGEYLAVPVANWQDKTDTLKDIFSNMLVDERSDASKPRIEIYQDMNNMLCLIKERSAVEETARNREVLLNEFNAATETLFSLLETFSPAHLNVSTTAHSWSAAQVAEHLIKSDASMLRILNGPATKTQRAPDMKVANLRAVFLNFNTTMESPRFVRPLRKTYEREQLLASLTTTRNSLRDVIRTHDLEATCTTIEEPALGDSTRLELLHFVLYHTLRHNHQLRKIQRQVTNLEPSIQNDGKG